MATEILRKGFVNKNGEKVQLLPAPHEHLISEVKGLNDALVGLSDRFEALDNGKQDMLIFDNTPTAGSTNPVTSGGLKAALTNLTPYRMVDGEGQEECEIYLYGHDGALLKAPTIDLRIGSEQADVSAVSLANLKRAMVNPDSTPTVDSDNLVTSGAVLAAINEVNEKIDNMHTLEYEDETYLSRMGVGKLNRDDDELDGASVYGKDAIRLGVLGGLVYIDAENIANLQRALEDPAAPASGEGKLITNGQVWDAIADLAYAETLNRRKLNIGGIYLIKGTTLADYTIENISTSAMQLYISGIAEIGRGRIDHLVIGLKDGATTYELLSTVYVEDPNRIELYIGDIVVIIGRNSQSVWELGSVTKISSLF